MPEATEGVELSYLWGVAFDVVTVETVEGLTFSPVYTQRRRLGRDAKTATQRWSIC